MGAAAPYIVMAVAAAATTYNTHRTAKKKDAQAAEGIRRQSELQKEADARLGKTLDKYDQSSNEPIEASLRQRYGDAARKKYAIAMNDLTEGSGAQSGAAEAKRETSTGQAEDYGQFFADKYAKLDAPGDQRRLEAYERLNLGEDLGVSRRYSAGEDYLTRMRVGSIQRNPWIDGGAAIANGIAGGMSAGSSPYGGTIAGNQGNNFQGAWQNYGYGQNPYLTNFRGP